MDKVYHNLLTKIKPYREGDKNLAHETALLLNKKKTSLYFVFAFSRKPEWRNWQTR
ncbi:MAG: hypothetical protein PHX74_06065 [Candidatus Sumerlaeales bacterium]|nr:hypothetical protein [Candidatus Sumerlaeales bacterium]